jgi:hypothetical protein
MFYYILSLELCLLDMNFGGGGSGVNAGMSSLGSGLSDESSAARRDGDIDVYFVLELGDNDRYVFLDAGDNEFGDIVPATSRVRKGVSGPRGYVFAGV